MPEPCTADAQPCSRNRAYAALTVARLTSNPNRFLSAVQVGVTLSGFLSAAFGGATLADELARGQED